MGSKIEEISNSIREKVTAKGTHSFSKGDLTNVSHALINSPEYTENVLIKQGEELAEVETKPVKKFRDALKSVATNALGIDKNEANKLDEYQFSKPFAEATAELGGSIIKNYIETGRKYTFPVTSKEESKMSIQIVDVEKKAINTRKIVKNDKGEYESVPTGKLVITKAHKGLKASNKILNHLKDSK